MEVQEVKEQLKAIFRTVINNDKWITKYDKEGEPYHVNIDDTEDKKEKQSDTKDEQSGSKGDLDIKKTTVKMKSGKEKEIEYVDKVPEGYKKLEGAMTAPLGYTWYHNGKSIIDKDRRTILVKDNENKQSDTKDGGEDFEKGTKSTKKDEDRHQKVRDLEDKAYKEFKTIYDNYIHDNDMEGWGHITGSQFGEAKEQFNKKYKDAFDKLESDRFVSFEDFAKRENKQSNSKDEKKADNSKEKDMTLLDELKKLITKVENNKENEEMIDNKKVDKRKLIDEVGGILKGKVDDEIIRTIIKKMEEASYNDSEASADNKKVKNEDDEEKKIDNEEDEDEEKVEELKKEEKKDIDNKCKNSKEESYFDKLNKIYNSAKKIENTSVEYEDKQARLDAGKEYFG